MMAQHLNPLFSESTAYAATYEATKIMIVYSASLGEQEPDTRMRLKDDIVFNMKALSEQTRGNLPSRAVRYPTVYTEVEVLTFPVSRPDTSSSPIWF